MFWLVKVGLYAAAAWANSRLQELRQPKDDTSPKPSGQADIQAPTVEEGRAIALLWGTCLLNSPNVTWYGSMQSNWSEYDQTFFYYLSMMYGWCHGPVDAVLSFRWDELGTPVNTALGGQVIPYPLLRESSPASIFVDNRSLFGGATKEGGVQGYYEFYWGTLDQFPDEYLRGKLGVPSGQFPAWRGLCYSIATNGQLEGDSFYQGTSSYMKPHSIVARRCPNQLGLTGGAHDIDGDANAACMLYELLTDDRWGLGLSAAVINTASLLAVGQALATEGFGLSLQQSDKTDPDEIIQEILRHIDAVIYPDRSTGLISLALVRDDYDPDELIELDDDSILELEDFGRGKSNELPNKVQLWYTDREQEYQRKASVAGDLAGAASCGHQIVQDMEFLGISNAALAQRVAARELKGLAYPFASMRLKVNRKAWSLRPGSPFKFSFAPLGIEGMVCRVVRMSLGPITDGVIRLEAVEDAFGVDWTAYSPPAPSQWVYPLQP